MKEEMNYGEILMNDKEITPYLDRFPHWVTLQKQGRFNKEKALLCTKNWKEGFLSIGTLTYSDVFQENKYPSIINLKQYLSKEHLDSLLVSLIQNFMDNYSNIKPIKPKAMNTLVRFISDDFTTLNLGDFRLFFDNMLKGEYGEIFGRLDVNVITVALKKYFEERLNAGALSSLNKHEKLKKQPMIVHKHITEQLCEKMKISKESEYEKKSFKDIYDFARYKGFDINAFTSFCTKNIKHQYQLLKSQEGDAFTISEFDYQNQWLNQLLSYVNETDKPTKQNVFEMMKTMKVEI